MARLPAMGRNAAAVAVLLISSVRKTISKAAPSTSTKRFVPCRKERPLPIHAASPEVSMAWARLKPPPNSTRMFHGTRCAVAQSSRKVRRGAGQLLRERKGDPRQDQESESQHHQRDGERDYHPLGECHLDLEGLTEIARGERIGRRADQCSHATDRGRISDTEHHGGGEIHAVLSVFLPILQDDR